MCFICGKRVSQPRIAKEILTFIKRDMRKLGISRLYLVTDHSRFYERHDWKFLTMAQDNEGIPVYLYQIDRINKK